MEGYCAEAGFNAVRSGVYMIKDRGSHRGGGVSGCGPFVEGCIEVYGCPKGLSEDKFGGVFRVRGVDLHSLGFNNQFALGTCGVVREGGVRRTISGIVDKTVTSRVHTCATMDNVNAAMDMRAAMGIVSVTLDVVDRRDRRVR